MTWHRSRSFPLAVPALLICSLVAAGVLADPAPAPPPTAAAEAAGVTLAAAAGRIGTVRVSLVADEDPAVAGQDPKAQAQAPLNVSDGSKDPVDQAPNSQPWGANTSSGGQAVLGANGDTAVRNGDSNPLTTDLGTLNDASELVVDIGADPATAAALQQLVSELPSRGSRLSDVARQDIEAAPLPDSGATDRWQDFDGTVSITPSGLRVTVPRSEFHSDATWWQSIIATVSGVGIGLVLRAACIASMPELITVCSAVGGFTTGLVRGVILQAFDGTLREPTAWAGTLVSALVSAAGGALWDGGLNRWAADRLPQLIGAGVANLRTWFAGLGALGRAAEGAAAELEEIAAALPAAVAAAGAAGAAGALAAAGAVG